MMLQKPVHGEIPAHGAEAAEGRDDVRIQMFPNSIKINAAEAEVKVEEKRIPAINARGSRSH